MPSRISKSVKILAVLLFMLTGAPQAAVLEGTMAKVDDNVILFSQLRARMLQMKLDPSDSAAEKQVLGQLVRERIIMQSYREFGFPAPSVEQVDALVKQSGATNEEAAAYLMQQRLMEYMVGSRVVVTDKMIKDYYDSHSDYCGQDSVKLRQIICSDEDKAKEAHKALKKGKDFDATAKLYAKDASLCDAGWIGLADLVPEAAAALKKAHKGSFVGPIKLRDSYIVYAVDDFGKAGGRTLEDSHDEIAKLLEQQYQQAAFEYWYTTTMAQRYVGVFM